jgi:PAS domain S-box-containing protein
MSRSQSTLDLQRRMDERVQGTLAILPVAAYTCDVDGRITCFNDRAEQLWGRRPTLNDATDRYCGSLSLLTVDGEHIPHEQCWTALALQSGSRYEGLEAVVVRPDGSRRRVLAYVSPVSDENGALVGATTILVDITARIQRNPERRGADDRDGAADSTEDRAAKALEASEANFRGFFESVAVGACQVGKDGLFMRVNDRYCEITGYSREELLKMGPLDLDHPEDREADRERVVKFVAGIDVAYRAEKRYVRKDGSIRWVRVAANLLHDANPNSIHSAAIVEDITERKLAEQALQDADRRKDEFIATLAHELRNPLAPMQTAVELLRDPDPAHAKWCHGVIARQLKHLTQLVADLLDISRITSNKLEVLKAPIRLVDVLQVAVESTNPLLERCDQQLIMTLPPEPLYLDGDLVRLAQVFSNLLSNAAKFTEGRGIVRLTAEATGADIQVTVADMGIGMSEAERARAFDKFFQGSRRPPRSLGGLGIGLSLVRQLVELHGGTIEARSAGPDRGSEFVVRLPARADAVVPARTMTAVPVAAASATRRVLIIDDNRDGARAIARLLRTMGHEVATAFEGRVAVERAKDFDPDVILLDLGMPDVDGFQVCQRLRANSWSRQRPRIVALTGWGREADLARTRRAGFDAHLVKPVDGETLEELLEQNTGKA